jgi:flavin-dependent dehydrogenase
MSNDNSEYDVIIAGAGPAGSSAAIHLAQSNLRVLLIDQKKFPREKLCGEFISPECRQHFENLGVADQIELASPAAIGETVFYSRTGGRLRVPSSLFGAGMAFGLSRAVMDQVLLQRAKVCGVDVRESATVSDLLIVDGRVVGVRARSENVDSEYRARVTIDATGRARILARKVDKQEKTRKSKLIAFKTHFTNTAVAGGTCEIYFYPGGYGGLSTVENNLSNLCFIVSARDVVRCQSDANRVMREVVMLNPRAAQTLRNTEASSSWLSASWDGFGRRSPSPVPGLLAIGDAAAFIDPFTGSGMLMAMESGQLVAETFVRLHNKSAWQSEELGRLYQHAYWKKFSSRLRLCRFLRTAAFAPQVVQSAIVACGGSERLWTWLAKSTRSNAVDQSLNLFGKQSEP